MYNNNHNRVEKVFFAAGDIVRVKHEIDNRPKMLVQEIVKTKLPGDVPGLLGVTCIWFDVNTGLCRHRFSTKDLEKC